MISRDPNDESAIVDAFQQALSARRRRPKIPDKIGTYRVKHVLASGGMGIVYLAEQEKPQRPVAIKTLRSEAQSESRLQRFQLESEFMARLNHPGIASIIEAGVEDLNEPTPYLVMEYVAGIPIYDFAQKNRLTARKRLQLIADVADAVHHAHQLQLIHRDIKPANILVDTEGRPKLVDFGIARPLDIDHDLTNNMTNEGQFLGTLAFMSPEQMKGEAVDIRTDVYSLGVVLYQLLGHQLPLSPKGMTLTTFVEHVQHKDPVRLGAVNPVLKGDVEAIVGKALERDKERRYSSAAAFSADIRRYLSGAPVEARVPSTFYTLSKIVRRHRAASAAVLLAFLVLLTGVTTLWFARNAALKTAEAASQEKRGDDLKEIAFSFVAFDRMANLEERSNTLWPRRPAQADFIQQWLEDARETNDRTKKLQLWHTGLTDESIDHMEVDLETFQWLKRRLSELISRISELSDPDLAHSIPSMEKRLLAIDEIEQATLDESIDAWEQAIDEIAGNPLYGGLELEPQLGWIPLGRNSEGYWEFWLYESGDMPEWDPNKPEVSEDSGMTFVLLPGTDEFAAFFISKYEMTRQQWKDLGGYDPSNYKSESDWSWMAPVDNMSWLDAMMALRRYELTLPTVAQWQWAAHGTAETPWWTGDDPSLLQDSENLADQSLYSRTQNYKVESWDDGSAVIATIGSFKPNPFGLFDILGNVSETCLDQENEVFTYCGGSFLTTSNSCKFGVTYQAATNQGSPDRGVRPVFLIQEE